MSVLNFIAFLGALVIAIAGGGGVWVYDHHGPLGVHAPWYLGHIGFDLPPSLRMQRDAALAQAKNAGAWQHDVVVLRDQLAVANRSIQAIADDRDHRIAAMRGQVRVAEKSADDAQRSVESLLAFHPAGSSVCERSHDAANWIRKDLSHD